MVEKRRGNGLGRTVTAFALGATAGSVIALLCAPASGRVTRKRIGLKFREIQRTTARQLEQTKKQLAKRAGYLRDAAAERLNGAREWVAERVTNGNGKHPARHRTVHQA